MWVSRTNTEIAVPQWSTLCVDVERTSKGAELHTAIPSLSSRLSDSWFPSKHPVRCQNPHFVIYPGDLVHLQSAILSTIYSLGKRLALEQGRSLNPPSGFTAQFIQIDKSLKERMEVESSCRAWSILIHSWGNSEKLCNLYQSPEQVIRRAKVCMEAVWFQNPDSSPASYTAPLMANSSPAPPHPLAVVATAAVIVLKLTRASSFSQKDMRWLYNRKD